MPGKEADLLEKTKLLIFNFGHLGCQNSLPTQECTLGEIHCSLLSPDEKNTELKKILTKIHLFLLDYFYSNIGTKL